MRYIDMKQQIRKIKKAIKIKSNCSKVDTVSLLKEKRDENKAVIWILGTEDFGNLGDHMIAVAQIHFFEKYFEEYQIIEIPARNYYQQRDFIIHNMREEDVVVGTGGGNMGNQYPGSEEIRYDFISLFPNNKIVIMPQTVWFTDDEQGKEKLEQTVELYKQHKKLLIATRERYSYELVKKYFSNETILVPDMVLSEIPYRMIKHDIKQESVSKKAVICLRNDLEKVLSKNEKKNIEFILKKEFSVIKKLDTQRDYLISVENREQELKECFDEFASADLVITDRLHGMVFAALAETPCIVFDNYNNKVRGIYEWIEELPYIHYKGTELSINEDIKKLKKLVNNCVFNVEGIEKRFEEFAEKIRNF